MGQDQRDIDLALFRAFYTEEVPPVRRLLGALLGIESRDDVIDMADFERSIEELVPQSV